MISKKVDIFLKTLAKHISKDADVLKKPKRLRKGFQHAVSSLKDSKLKEILLDNLDDCFTELLKIIKQQHANELKANRNGTDSEQIGKVEGILKIKSSHNIDKPPLFIYNLYHKKDLGIKYETLSQLEKSTQNIVFRTYMRCVLPYLDSKNLLDIAAKSQKTEDGVFSWANQIMELCACLHGDTNCTSLRAVMKVFNKKYAEVAENAIKAKRILKLLSYGEQFLKMFHFHNKTINQEFEGRPKYEDFMAGILATHLDCHLQLFHCDTSLCPLTGKQLCSFVLSLLGKQHHYGYDVLLQLEHVQSGDGSLILPLARYLLDNVKPRDSCCLYTKFVLAARFVRQWLPNDGIDDIVQKAHDVPAPAQFLDWIRNLDPNLLDQFPETKHFQGIQITKYLLNEADEDLIQELFDLLTESYRVESRSDKAHKSDTFEETDAVDDTDLFVIDKAPDLTACSTVKDLIVLQEKESAKNTLQDQDLELDSEEEIVLNNNENEVEGNVQYEILTMEEALEMNLIERTEMALEHIFDMECKEDNERRDDTKEMNEMVDDDEQQEQRMDGIQELNDEQEFNETLDGIMIEIVDKDVELGLVLGDSDQQNSNNPASVKSSADVVIIEDSNSEESAIVTDAKVTSEQVQVVQQTQEGVKSKNSSSKLMTADNHNVASPISDKKRKSVETLGSPLQKVGECDSMSEICSKHGSSSKDVSLVADDNLIVTEVSSPSIQRNVNRMNGYESQEEDVNTSAQCALTVTAFSGAGHSVDQNNSFTKLNRRKPATKRTASESVITEGKSSPRKKLGSMSQQEAGIEVKSTSEELNMGENSPTKPRTRNRTRVNLQSEKPESVGKESLSPKKMATQITSKLVEGVNVEEQASSPQNVRNQRSSLQVVITKCDLAKPVINISSHLEKEGEQQLKEHKPVTRRLKELKGDIDIASKRKKILSGAEMVKSLKAAKSEELTVFPKTYSGRRHSTSASNKERCDSNSNPDARTPRKAATKAMEMLAILSPRKRRDSLSSFHSSEDDVALTKSRKLTEEKPKIDISSSVKKLKSENTIKTRRSSMPPKQLAKELDGSCSPSKPTPSKKVTAKISTPKNRYSLRTLEKATKDNN